MAQNVPFFFEGGRKVLYGADSLRTTDLAASEVGARFQVIGGNLYESNGTGWNLITAGGAGNVQPMANGVSVTPGFSPALALQLTVSNSMLSIAVGDATMFRLKGLSATSQKIAWKYGTSLLDTISATLDNQFCANILSSPEYIAIPNGVKYIHLIRNDAADVSVQLTLS